MRVKELIKELGKYDEDMEVIIHHKGMYHVNIKNGSIVGVPCVWLKAITIGE